MTRLVYERGDITTQEVDAIVNAANSSLMGGGGVDGAIHRAGGPAILEACKALRAGAYRDGLPPGQAVATTAGLLRAKHVIHTVGPVYSASQDRSELLASAYRQSISVAVSIGDRSIAFPAISAGVYGWPMADAARIAVSTVVERIRLRPDALEVVRFVLFSDAALQAFEHAAASSDG